MTGATDFVSVQTVSHYPVLPPRFVQREDTAHSFDYEKLPERFNQFQVKLAPGGVTVVEVERKPINA